MQDLVSATDPAGHSHSYLVDGFHHVTQHNDPAGKSTLYRYDANGALTKITDPRSKGTIYTRNGFGDVVSLVSPDTGTTTFSYDSAGNVLTRKDAKGQTLTYHYDALNRLTDVSSSVSGESATTLSYDGTLNGKSRLTGINEPSGNTVFDYNNEGLLNSAVWTPGNANSNNPSPYQIRYTYDAAGRLTTLTYPSGLTVNYARDADGQVTGITATTADGVTTQLASDIQYKPFGPMQHLVYGNGLIENRRLNANYQVENITAGTVLNLSYSYGPQGNILTVADNLNPAYGHVVSYDALDRLLTSSGWYGVYSFEYDATGNRTAITRSGTKDAYTLSTSNNWLTKTGLSATSYSVDATGNLIKRGTDTFAYDSQNRLTSATVSGTTAQYQYNIAGQRVAKTVAGQTTYYLYGQDGQLLAEADAGTQKITRQYIWLGNKPVAYLFGDKGYYVHTDNTDTPQVLTDSQQKVVWTTQTYPFGKQQYSGSIAFNLRYPGQYFDEETGLHYNGHRYYDPNTGRYITSDPIGLAGGLNTYAYVGSNPLGFVDPLGLDANDISETPGQRSLEQLHSQEHDVVNPLVDTDLNNDGIQDVVSPVVLNGGSAAKPRSSSCKSTPEITQINPRNLIPTQTRNEMSSSQIKRLTKSMEKNGFDQDQPVDVWQRPDGRLEIQDGHHRTEAAKQSGLDTIPVRIWE